MAAVIVVMCTIRRSGCYAKLFDIPTVFLSWFGNTDFMRIKFTNFIFCYRRRTFLHVCEKLETNHYFILIPRCYCHNFCDITKVLLLLKTNKHKSLGFEYPTINVIKSQNLNKNINKSFRMALIKYPPKSFHKDALYVYTSVTKKFINVNAIYIRFM